jgi:hypothetical protein
VFVLALAVHVRAYVFWREQKTGVNKVEPLWIHKLNFSWVNLVARDQTIQLKSQAEIYVSLPVSIQLELVEF